MENTEILDYINKQNLNYKNFNNVVEVLMENLKLTRGKVLKVLASCMEEGSIVESGKNKIATATKMGLVKGVVSGHSKGFAFVVPTDSSMPHIFIPPKSLETALHNDIVLIRIVEGRRGDSSEGAVYKILKRGTNVVVGTIEVLNGYAFVIPDNSKFNKDIFVSRNNINNAKNGEKVVVKILNFDNRKPEGKVVEVLGDGKVPSVEVLSIIRNYELIEEFTPELLALATSVKQTIDPKDIEGRADLRDMNIITIDGDDAKDLDDAISIKYDKEKDIYKLGVHIADVGHYVKKDGLIDREAFKRGTSVYFPHTVFPMLPRELSNGICSLHPKVDRLTLSIFMDINTVGDVVDYFIAESVINSKQRMNYTNVTKILEGDAEMNKRYSHISDDLKIMAKLSSILEAKRNKRGALDFDFPETKIVVNPISYEVVEMKRRERTESHKLIESFMLAANETIAEHMHKVEVPFVYRVHEKPSEAKILAFKEYIEPFGLKIKEGNSEVKPKDLQKFLTRIKDLEYKNVISKVLLRSMQKAKYMSNCLGHYGLAAKYYTHFTSPIRRYPDLTIHRIIKDWLNDKTNANYNKRLKTFVEEASFQSSVTEVAAEKCEREVDDYFKAKYMENKIGEEFEGIISGVTQHGIFVELDNTIEGFVRVQDFDGDGYVFKESRYELTNGITSYKMGGEVSIKVVSASAIDRRVDFVLK